MMNCSMSSTTKADRSTRNREPLFIAITIDTAWCSCGRPGNPMGADSCCSSAEAATAIPSAAEQTRSGAGTSEPVKSPWPPLSANYSKRSDWRRT